MIETQVMKRTGAFWFVERNLFITGIQCMIVWGRGYIYINANLWRVTTMLINSTKRNYKVSLFHDHLCSRRKRNFKFVFNRFLCVRPIVKSVQCAKYGDRDFSFDWYAEGHTDQ